MHKLKMTLAGMITAIVTMSVSSVDANDTWPQWRGPEQNGVAPGEGYPLQWSEDTGLRWNRELPGRGGSTPVVHNGTAYLTSGIEGNNTLLAIDVQSGETRWQTDLGEDTGGKHRKGSGSNPSPVVDEDSVFAYFRSGDLACVDHNGKVRWTTNLQERYGEDTLWWDLGSSPTLTEDAVVVAVMQTGPSYLVAFDKQSGSVLWKTDRMLGAPEEAAQSYSTPLNVEVDGRKLIAVMGADHLTLHEASTGRELARLGGFNPDGEKFFRSIASPVADGNIIVCPYARGSTLTGVRMDQLLAGKGKDAIVWFRDDLGSDVPTPAALNGKLYVVSDDKRERGKIACLDIETGEDVWTLELPRARGGTSFSSSPLVAGNHLYVTREDAVTFVIGPLDSDDPQLQATNEVADTDPYTVSSLIPIDGGLLLRTRNRLYGINGQ